ncbi:MAG: phosphopentomutase [Vampirovibrionales bacterium]|nr:phosphopentomutase [Vampirovibrionales bacterium]
MALDNQKRVFVIVIDAFGVGGLPDAAEYGDRTDFNTLGGIDRQADHLNLPTLEKLGIGHLGKFKNVQALSSPVGSYGKMSEMSRGKDTTTGHWEMMGIYLETPFPTYPEGFPKDVMDRFMAETGVKGYLGNKPASGTDILKELGEAHLKTGHPIIYTSADSVFQIAAHVGPESKCTLEDLYRWCETARRILRDEHQVSRVIARPFLGANADTFKRIGESRRDYAVTPIEKTTLNRIQEQGGVVLGIGKIEDIFNFSGLTHSWHTGNNPDGLNAIAQIVRRELDWDSVCLEKNADGTPKALSDYVNADKQFIFVNLVDTDSIYGHRRDVNGYARALEQVDTALVGILAQLGENDLLMISADHGCDPTAPGSDHTREFVPILLYGKNLPPRNLGVRDSFADIGRTVLEWLALDKDGQRGKSLLPQEAPALV